MAALRRTRPATPCAVMALALMLPSISGPAPPPPAAAGLPPPTWMVEGNQIQVYMGYSVASAGDINGDGHEDLIVGAPRYNHRLLSEGGVFVYLGSPTGPGTVPDWQAFPGQSAARMGISVGSAGDVNGDGFDDILVSAWLYNGGSLDEGRVFVWYGGPDGLGEDGNPGNADWYADSNQDHAGLGYSTAAAGDVNGDGYDDILVGCDLCDDSEADEGLALAWHGGPDGLGPPGHLYNADWKGVSGQASAFFGFSVAGAGDVNGDGYDDVLVGAPGYDDTEPEEGAAFLYLGGPDGLGPDGFPGNADWSVTGGQGGAYAGIDVAGAGDVDGDGYGDVLVGAYLYDVAQPDEGIMALWLGGEDGPSPAISPEDADWLARSDQPDARFGISVARAGDVNGDGYDDILAGATRYDLQYLDEGAAFLWYGGPQGPPGLGLPEAATWVIPGNQQGATLGLATGPAGDLNRDGLDDFVVGMHRHDAGLEDEGAALAFQGCLDLDGDGACDGTDVCPGVPDPDQGDGDGDGVGDACDCMPADASTWAPPDGWVALALDQAVGSEWTGLAWMPPSEPGTSMALAYDTLRSGTSESFMDSTTCLESSDTDEAAVDGETPAADSVLYYLIRPLNGCGDGFIGADSGSQIRSARNCL